MKNSMPVLLISKMFGEMKTVQISVMLIVILMEFVVKLPNVLMLGTVHKLKNLPL